MGLFRIPLALLCAGAVRCRKLDREFCPRTSFRP